MNALAQPASEDPYQSPEATPESTTPGIDSPESEESQNVTNLQEYIRENALQQESPLQTPEDNTPWTRFIPPNTPNFKARILDMEITIENGLATIKNAGPMIFVKTPNGEKPLVTHETVSFELNPNDPIYWRRAK